MKTPIEGSDIRVGDRVMAVDRGFETTFTVDHIDGGRIYARAGNGGHHPNGFLWDSQSDWYLLDRPTPPVVLPTEPTLGWLTQSGLDRFGHFRQYIQDESTSGRNDWTATETDSRGKYRNAYCDVTAFTPATAVPTDALEKLRAAENAAESGTLIVDWARLVAAVRDFLASVETANGTDR